MKIFKLIKWSTSFIIMGTNWLIVPLVSKLIKRFGYTTISEKIKNKMKYVFLLQFLNTGPFTVLANSDFRDLKIPIISDYLIYGHHKDFTVDWYQDVGKAIIFTMWWNYIVIYIVKCILLLIKGFLKRKCGLTFNLCSKPKIILEYLDLYSDSKYKMHKHYAFILNIVFITFMFGAGMPILFPITFFVLLVFYFMEKIMIIWYYKEPKMTDDALNSKSIKWLMFAPILYCAIGFWMFKNPAIFTNKDLKYAATLGEPLGSELDFENTLLHPLNNFNSAPFFITFCLMVLFNLNKEKIMKYLSKKIGLGRLGSKRFETVEF